MKAYTQSEVHTELKQDPVGVGTLPGGENDGISHQREERSGTSVPPSQIGQDGVTGNAVSPAAPGGADIGDSASGPAPPSSSSFGADHDLDALADALDDGSPLDRSQWMGKLGEDVEEDIDHLGNGHPIAQIERVPVGDKGITISIRGSAPDGQERWGVYDQYGMLAAVFRGREAAERAAHQLSETGVISR